MASSTPFALVADDPTLIEVFTASAEKFGGIQIYRDWSDEIGEHVVFTTKNVVNSSSNKTVIFLRKANDTTIAPVVYSYNKLTPEVTYQMLVSSLGFGQVVSKSFELPGVVIENSSAPPLIPAPAKVVEAAKHEKRGNIFKGVKVKAPAGALRHFLVWFAFGATSGLAMFLWYLFTPLAMLGLSGFCMKVAMPTSAASPSSASRFLLSCSQNASVLAQKTSLPLSHFDVFKRAYHTSRAINIGTNLWIDVLSNLKDTNPDLLSYVKSLSLVNLSQQSAVLSALTQNLGEEAPAKELETIQMLARFAPLVESIGKNSQSLLGEKKPSVFLIVFQNSMELRPTGGFMGSFALVELFQGKVQGWRIYDIYDADGQLQGYVKPPDPIVEHLGEASWWMRDSNWDPDFATTANRLMWFLDKSMDITVDGVISVNLDFLGLVLEQLGPVTIPDTNETIDAQNYYKFIQDEVHGSFFPGSTKKKTHLTSIANAVYGKLENASMAQIANIVSSYTSQMGGKKIQVWVREEEVMAQLSALGLDGGVKKGSVGYVEANVGVNKANQFIKRSASIQLEMGESGNTIVTQKLNITNSSANKDAKTDYKTYVRGMAPAGSIFKSLVVNDDFGKREPKVDLTEVGDRLEFGAIVYNSANKTSEIKLVYEIKPESTVLKEGKRGVWFFRQSGVENFDLNIIDLTEGAKYEYNTTLEGDYFIPIKALN